MSIRDPRDRCSALTPIDTKSVPVHIIVSTPLQRVGVSIQIIRRGKNPKPQANRYYAILPERAYDL